jgi:hypothetical protein
LKYFCFCFVVFFDNGFYLWGNFMAWSRMKHVGSSARAC